MPHLHWPLVQLSALTPPSRHEPHAGAGEPGTAQALTEMVPTQRERPPPRSSQQPGHDSGSQTQRAFAVPPSLTHTEPRPHWRSSPHAQPRVFRSH